jgi:hypothetical protein
MLLGSHFIKQEITMQQHEIKHGNRNIPSKQVKMNKQTDNCSTIYFKKRHFH